MKGRGRKDINFERKREMNGEREKKEKKET
jgi:hypothetical protein